MSPDFLRWLERECARQDAERRRRSEYAMRAAVAWCEEWDESAFRTGLDTPPESPAQCAAFLFVLEVSSDPAFHAAGRRTK